MLRYTLLQIPGWALVGLALTLLLHWEWLDRTAAAIVLGLWLLKDVLLYPLYRPALAVGDATAPGVAALRGYRGWCRTHVNGHGLVEIHGERWLARAVDGRGIPPDSCIEVVDHEGMTLLVRQADAGTDTTDA